MSRELKTVEAMTGLYCATVHSQKKVCPECSELLAYVHTRLEKCPYGKDKPTCARCPVHCYKPDMRQKIRAVMRYSGPRMIYRHPLLALQHMLDKHRHPPVDPLKGHSNRRPI